MKMLFLLMTATKQNVTVGLFGINSQYKFQLDTTINCWKTFSFRYSSLERPFWTTAAIKCCGLYLVHKYEERLLPSFKFFLYPFSQRAFKIYCLNNGYEFLRRKRHYVFISGNYRPCLIVNHFHLWFKVLPDEKRF